MTGDWSAEQRGRRGEEGEEGEEGEAGSGDSGKKASCAVAIGVGYLSDPADLGGLAHFTEHMLFMGTERFPDENGWGAYLSARGGSDNGEANPNPNPNPNPSPNPSPNPTLTLTPTRRDRCRAHRLLL